jgi:hypothetical protein
MPKEGNLGQYSTKKHKMHFVCDLKNSYFVLSYGEITANNKRMYINLRHYFDIWPEATKKAKEYRIQDIRICG